MDPDERFDLIVDSVIDFEGGHSLNPNDRGNWTGGKVGSGILRGTKYGISAASYPDLDIANLTIPDAKGIYYRDYWLEGECNLMPGAMAALHFDAIVQHGLFYANEFLRAPGGAPTIFDLATEHDVVSRVSPERRRIYVSVKE